MKDCDRMTDFNALKYAKLLTYLQILFFFPLTVKCFRVKIGLSKTIESLKNSICCKLPISVRILVKENLNFKGFEKKKMDTSQFFAQGT